MASVVQKEDLDIVSKDINLPNSSNAFTKKRENIPINNASMEQPKVMTI